MIELERETETQPAHEPLDDEQRVRLRAKGIRRLRKYLEEWTALRASSPRGLNAVVKQRDVDKYNDALNKLRLAGEPVAARYYVAGPVIPKWAVEGQKFDGIPLTALLGKAQGVLLRFDPPASDADAS